MPEDEIISNFAWSESYEKALQNLFRLGVLSRSSIDDQEKISFEFNKFLLYVYVFRVKKLHTLPSNDQIALLQELLRTSIGIEALDFYLAAVGQSVAHKLLIELATEDFPLFAQIITALKGIDNYKKSPIPFEHILSYLEFYNFLRDRYFGELSNVTMPYAPKPLGVILLGKSDVRFRACTNGYPQPIVNIDDGELITQFFQGPINQQLFQDLLPVGALHIGGFRGFAEYPQKASYEHLIREISSALSNRVLNESVSRDILQERVYAILLHSPSVWMVGDDLPPRKHYWEILGYESVETLGETTVSELVFRIRKLSNDFNEKLLKLNRSDALFPSYYHRSRELIAILFALSQLKTDEPLGSVRYSPNKLSRTSGKKIEIVEEEMKKLISLIIENYKLVFAENFPSLTDYSLFFNNLDKLAIVEILRLKSISEFPALSYIVFPNSNKPISTRIVNTLFNHSITGNLKFRTLYGEGYSQGGGSGSGYNEIDVAFDGMRLHDPEAWIIKTRFSYLTPILDQVYALISQDLKSILRAKFLDWPDNRSSNLINDTYLRMAADSMMDNN